MSAAERKAAVQRALLADALGAVGAALADLLGQGALRATPAGVSELQALAQQCHAAGAIHLSRAVEGLATQLKRVVERDPLASLSAWATALNRAWAQHRALAAAAPADADLEALAPLLGEARRRYDAVDGALTVQCLYAWGWVTDAGFMGVTFRLACAERPEPLTVSLARPTLHFGDEPARLWAWPLHDALPQTGKDLGHGAWRVDQAKLSADGRLSLHGELGLTPAPWQGAQAWQPLRCAGFAEVLDRLAEQAADLAGDGAGGAVVWIEPAAVGPLTEDRTRGHSTLTLTDGAGAEAQVVVPMAPWHRPVVENLTLLARGTDERGRPLPMPRGWIARATVAGDRLVLMPYTVLFDAPIELGGRGARTYTHQLHLSLEELSRARWAKGSL
ncbi:MAG: hypothetical protein H6702_07315 [Myxococcales bacterium]|nr:hypothetical protein [Myxococcales bacterium]